MANQYKNKVVYYGDTLIDLSEDTVAADKLLAGCTAHDKSGAPITGTLVPSGGTINLQEKTVIPTEQQQVILPDKKAIKALDNYSGTSNNSIQVNHAANTRYIRINGDIQVVCSYANVTYHFTNAISEISGTSPYTYPIIRYPLTPQIDGVTVDGTDIGGVLTDFYYQKYSAQSYGYLRQSRDVQDYSTITATNLTIEFCEDLSFGSDDYDALSKVTVEPIPSNYIDIADTVVYRTGSTPPSSSLGNDGDIYLQMAE